VQGHLLREKVSSAIETECGHCHQPIQVEIDSDLHFHLPEGVKEPLIYSPLLDVHTLEPSIIDGF